MASYSAIAASVFPRFLEGSSERESIVGVVVCLDRLAGELDRSGGVADLGGSGREKPCETVVHETISRPRSFRRCGDYGLVLGNRGLVLSRFLEGSSERESIVGVVVCLDRLAGEFDRSGEVADLGGSVREKPCETVVHETISRPRSFRHCGDYGLVLGNRGLVLSRFLEGSSERESIVGVVVCLDRLAGELDRSGGVADLGGPGREKPCETAVHETISRPRSFRRCGDYGLVLGNRGLVLSRFLEGSSERESIVGVSFVSTALRASSTALAGSRTSAGPVARSCARPMYATSSPSHAAPGPAAIMASYSLIAASVSFPDIGSLSALIGLHLHALH